MQTSEREQGRGKRTATTLWKRKVLLTDKPEGREKKVRVVPYRFQKDTLTISECTYCLIHPDGGVKNNAKEI